MKTVRYYNPNPLGKNVGDCVIRALTKALDMSWEQVYSDLVSWGFVMADMPSSNAVWGAYLRHSGWKKRLLPDECPDCFTIGDFTERYPSGAYVVGTGTHTAAVVDGEVYDSWNSIPETVTFFFEKGD